MEPINISEIIEKLNKFNIIPDKETTSSYYNLDGNIIGGSHKSMESFLTPHEKGSTSDVYESYVFNLNRAWALFLDLFNEDVDPSGVYNIKNKIVCETCLILSVTAFETYLFDKFLSITEKIKIPHIEKSLFDVMEISSKITRKSFQNKDIIKEMYKSIGIIFLTNSKKHKPVLSKEETYLEINKKLWDKIFENNRKQEKYGYMMMRNKIVHKYSISNWKILTIRYISNCLLDLTEMIYTIEGVINKKYKDLIQFPNWSEFKIDLRK